MPDASAPLFSYDGVPNKQTPVSTEADADDAFDLEDAANAVFVKYYRLQQEHQANFRRELANALVEQDRMQERRLREKKNGHLHMLSVADSALTDAANANAHIDAGTTQFDGASDESAVSDLDDLLDGRSDDGVMIHSSHSDRSPVTARSNGSARVAAALTNGSANGFATNGSTTNGCANGSINSNRTNRTNGTTAAAAKVANGNGTESANATRIANCTCAAATAEPVTLPGDVGAPPDTSKYCVQEEVEAASGHGAQAGTIANVPTDMAKIGSQGLSRISRQPKNVRTVYTSDPTDPTSSAPVNGLDTVRAPVAPRKPRVRASKLEFKRLDHLYNKTIHDFYLVESSQTTNDKDDKWEEYVFVVRRRFDWQNKYQNTVIDLKSPEIVAVLREVLRDVKPVSLHDEKPSIDPGLLFNYRKDINNILEKEEILPEETRNKTRIKHLSLLKEYIDADYASVAQRLQPLLEHGEITFDLLWALFLPNTLCYTKCGGSNEPMCLKLDWGSEKFHPQKGKFFSMECHYVDYDGRNFGECKATVEIPEFEGTCPIESLPFFPLERHPNVDSLRKRLLARGRKFGTLTGMQYKYYKGLAFFKKENKLLRVTVQSRIMVDSLTFRRMNPNYNSNPVKPGAGKYGGAGDGEDDLDDMGLGEDNIMSTGTGGGGGPTSSNGEVFAVTSMRMVDRLARMRGGSIAGAPKVPTRFPLTPEKMSEEQLLMCSPTVLGFSFGDKMWAEFAVDSIHEIIFNTGAFDSLVLPESQKSIVRALVENHSGKGQGEKKRPGIDDIIRGKGRGLVAVLHGRPGVGKTLTAEGISEYLRKPLYMVSAGELGTDSRVLEVQLTKILDICYGWGAVLLLDEADVFLERRSVHELQRNALVSIFLRQLEYFQGIMFLTTNRVETFDEAFQSRIHIALKYNDLDRKAKKIIWGTFLDMVARDELAVAAEGEEGVVTSLDMAEQKAYVQINGEKDAGTKKEAQLRQVVTKMELDGLARHELNGRQIKNVVRTAQALARSMEEVLAMKHLTRVLEVTQEFEHDLKGTGQIDGMMSYA